MNHFLIENKIIADVKQQDIKHCISATACRIPERLHRHELFEWWIEPIDNCMYKSNNTVDHEAAKVKIWSLVYTWFYPSAFAHY